MLLIRFAKVMYLMSLFFVRGIEHVYSIADISAVFYLVLLIIVFFIIGATKYQRNHKTLYKHFIACFSLKFLGCLAFIAIYTFYYGYGDTFRYYWNAKPLMDMAIYSPFDYLDTVAKTSVENGLLDKGSIYFQNIKPGQVFDMHHDKSSNLVVRLTSFFGLFSLGSYISISLLFASVSTLGVWSLYRTFTYLFPGHENALSIPIIYFPSVFFWGSSIMKDTIVLGFLGFLTYSLYHLLIKKSRIIPNLLLLLVSVYILTTTKEYVIISYVPALLLWIFLSVSNSLPNWTQYVIRPVLLVFAVAAIFVVGPKVGEISQNFAIDQVLKTAETTSSYIYSISQDGSGYTLGDVSYDPQGLVSLFPRAVVVTLFRPFIFEVSNVVMLISSIESSLVLFFTIFVLFRIGIFKFINTLFQNPFLLAALTFSIFFAFAIGASTYNFGALVRYKIPCLPFYGLAIIYPYSKYRLEKKLKKTRV